MSPVNSGESSGDEFSDSGRQLTRKEIRAREKSLATESNDVVPPQAFETGHSPVEAPSVPSAPPSVPAQPATEPTEPTEPPVQAAPSGPEAAPEMPEAPPTVQQQEVPVHYEEPVQHEAYVHPEEPAYHEPLHPEEPVLHEAAEDHDPYAHEASGDPHGGPGHHHYVDPHEDEAHHVYDDADVYATEDHPDQHFDEPAHPLMGAGSSVAVVPAKSKKVRRRRRWLALLLTLAVFVTALVVGAQFLKPLLGGDTVADFPGPGTGQVNVSVEPGEGTRSVATKLAEQKVIANPDTFLSRAHGVRRNRRPGGVPVPPGNEEFRRRRRPAGQGRGQSDVLRPQRRACGSVSRCSPSPRAPAFP